MRHRFFSSAVVSGIIFIEFLVSSVMQQICRSSTEFFDIIFAFLVY